MTILVKNKHSLLIDEFKFRCCIGKKRTSINKIEGDQKTPKGNYRIGDLYFRSDRLSKPKTRLRCIKIKHHMAWCDDVNYPKKYNKLINISNKIKHERLKRIDRKYDLLIPIKYNFEKPIPGLGSCIFIHLTKDYNPTEGCIALSQKDFLIMLKIIKKNSIIKIL